MVLYFILSGNTTHTKHTNHTTHTTHTPLGLLPSLVCFLNHFMSCNCHSLFPAACVGAGGGPFVDLRVGGEELTEVVALAVRTTNQDNNESNEII